MKNLLKQIYNNMNTLEIISKLKTYILNQIDTMATTNPVIGFIKPFITRALDKNINKISKVLDLITDNNGNIDIEEIISEMADNLVNTNPFILNTSFIGDIEIGGGLIKLNIPFTNKKIVFNKTDIDNLKEILTTNTL